MKILAILGSILVWLPIVFPVVLGLVALVTMRVVRFDYLMPAELFPMELVGGGVLSFVAWKKKSFRKLVIGSLVIGIAALVAAQGLAVLTGLASGEAEPVGWKLAIVMAGIVIYDLGMVAVGVGGILLAKRINLSK